MYRRCIIRRNSHEDVRADTDDFVPFHLTSGVTSSLNAPRKKAFSSQRSTHRIRHYYTTIMLCTRGVRTVLRQKWAFHMHAVKMSSDSPATLSSDQTIVHKYESLADDMVRASPSLMEDAKQLVFIPDFITQEEHDALVRALSRSACQDIYLEGFR